MIIKAHLSFFLVFRLLDDQLGSVGEMLGQEINFREEKPLPILWKYVYSIRFRTEKHIRLVY